MIKQTILGGSYLFRGLRLLGAPGVKRFVAIPMAINVVVFTGLLWLVIDHFEQISAQVMPQLPEWLAWLTWVLWLVFIIVAVGVAFFTFTIIASLIAAPFNSLLAEAVERQLTGRTAPGEGVGAVLRSAPAQIADEFRKFGYYLKHAVPLLLLFLIPGVNLLAPFLWAVFGAWMLVVQYADYPLGNHGLRSRQQREVLQQARFVALGFGGATMVATLIPLVNLLVMPTAVAGATAMVVERYRI